MKPYLETEDVTLYCADVFDGLSGLADDSINACITSPPYFSLRNYGVEGQIGLEATPSDYVGKMVGVFREVRRTLRADGTLWLNLGDSYCRNPAKGQHKPGASGKQNYIYARGGGRASAAFDLARSGLKEKDLVGVPWRVALALQQPWLLCRECSHESHASRWGALRGTWRVCPSCEQMSDWSITEPGWYLRSDVIWHKPNALPNSVKDRPVTDHEYVFLLSKEPRYYFDHEVLKEETTSGKTRSKRTVWSIRTSPSKEGHAAIFPEDLVRPMLLASVPKGGLVLDPFSGSGTTALVAIQNSRKAIGIDINPASCEIARRRLTS